MARDTLRFTSSGENIYDPLTIFSESTSPGEVLITVTNYGSSAIEGVGLYIKPASNLGSVDNPAESPPETDYQDVLFWGTRSTTIGGIQGGIKAYIPSTILSGSWITRTYGATYKTKIPIGDLAAGASSTLILEFTTPSDVISRRLFLDIVVE